MAKFEIDLNLQDVKIINIETTKAKDLVITVKSTQKSAICHNCGQKITKIHGYGDAIMLQHLPILGQDVYIRLRPARFQCESCDNKPTTTEETTWYNKRSKFTKAYEEWLMKMLINSNIYDVARKEDLSSEDIEGVLNRQMETHVDWHSIETLPYFGLDDIALKKGHKDFVVVVSTRVEDKVKILAILSDRKQELKRLKKELNETDYAKLKGAMWALSKSAEGLTEQDKTVLEALFEYSPNLKEAYDFRNSLTDIFNQNLNKGEAAILIKEWMNNVKASQLSCFDKFIETLSKNWHEVLNYFYHRQRKNSGFIEELNNKIKVIKRRCYGIFDLTRLFQRIILDLTGYERFA